MAIILRYACASCVYTSGHLDEVQAHANKYGHTVRVSGEITPQDYIGDGVALAQSAERKAREAAIMRHARDRGLLKGQQDHVRKFPGRSDLGIIADEILKDVKDGKK